MAPGFGFQEEMTGTWRRPDGTEGAFAFDFVVTAESAGLATTGTMVGRVRMDGVAEDAPAEGTIEMDPLRGRRIAYRFSFQGDDGRLYRFAGEKRIRWLHALRTWTTLPGAVLDEEGTEVASVVAYFDRSEIFPFLRTFHRVRRSDPRP